MRPPGFEPGQRAREANKTKTVTSPFSLIIDYRKYKNDFANWLRNRIDHETARKYIRYLDKYLTKPITSPKDFQKILQGIDKPGVRRWFTKAFRNLLNYLEEIEGVDETLLAKFRKVAKIERSGVREVFITTEELVQAYHNILPKYRILFKLLVYSGIRLDHAVDMLANFDGSNLVIKDNIARYPIATFSRGHKKAFWAYIPTRFADEIERVEFNYNAAKAGIIVGRVSALSIRKWHLNFMIENGIPESVADFIQGRASVTVGSTHYLNKTKQADQFYSKIVDKFPI